MLQSSVLKLGERITGEMAQPLTTAVVEKAIVGKTYSARVLTEKFGPSVVGAVAQTL